MKLWQGRLWGMGVGTICVIIVGIMAKDLLGREFVHRYEPQLRLRTKSAISRTPWSPVGKFFMVANPYFRWMCNP
jgi:hypothetical protein